MALAALLSLGGVDAGAAGGNPVAQPVTASAIAIAADDGGARIVVSLSAPVAIDIHALAAPPRIVVDLPLVTWRLTEAVDGVADPGRDAALVAGVRYGLAAPGRSRLVVDLSAPGRVLAATVAPTADGADLTLKVAPGNPDRFADPPPPARAAPSDGGLTGLTVAVDAGHGGGDPGAVAGDMVEKDVTLAFAKALADALTRGGARVAMTREDDVFVGLDARVARARAAGADVLLSLHADAAPQAHVAGASVYTLSRRVADAAAAALAGGDDAMALATLFPTMESDLARVLAPAIGRRTAASSAALGAALLDGMAAQTPVLAGRPLRAAAFQVLRAPDIASALIELGFLSNAEDRARLADPDWRAATAAAIVAALAAWADAAGPHGGAQ